LFVQVYKSSGIAQTVDSVTYNSVAMTKIDTFTDGVYGEITTWRLAAPATGSNTVEITFSAGPFNNISSSAQSVTGSSGEGNIAKQTAGGPPQTVNVTVSENSVIWAGVMAGLTGTDVTIDGSSRTIDWNNSANNFHFGGISLTGLTSGSKVVSGDSGATVAIMGIEIQESGGGGVTSKNTQAVWL
jgi:hypothetical protein